MDISRYVTDALEAPQKTQSPGEIERLERNLCAEMAKMHANASMYGCIRDGSPSPGMGIKEAYDMLMIPAPDPEPYRSPSPQIPTKATRTRTETESPLAPRLPNRREYRHMFKPSLYRQSRIPPVQSPRTAPPFEPLRFLDDGTNVPSPQNIEMLLTRRDPTQPLYGDKICYISTKYFETTLAHLRMNRSLDAENFVRAFKGLLAMRYFKWEHKHWYFGADYSLVEEKDLAGYCKSLFEQTSYLRPGVKFETAFLEAISHRKIVHVDARRTLDPCWESGDDGIYAEIPTVPICTHQTMSVPQPSKEVLDCCSEMHGFLFFHMCGGDEVTYKVVANFFFATVLGIKLDVMIFLYGPKGTGKSAFVSILRHMVGKDLFQQTSVDKFSNSGYVKGKTFIAVHEAEKPNIECLKNMKERVTDPLMSHNRESFNCIANFVFCGNVTDCDELLNDRRCFSIYLDKKPTPAQAEFIKNFLDLIEKHPEVASVFYDKLHEHVRDTIGDFVNGAQTWLRKNEIDQQRRGNCIDDGTVTENKFNPFHINNQTNEAIQTLIEHVHQNSASSSTKKIPLPSTINERLNKEILNVVESLGITVTKCKGVDVVAPMHLAAALFRLSYPQIVSSNGALARRVAALENAAGAQPANQPLDEDTDSTTTYVYE